MTFLEHKEITITDCEEIIKSIQDVINKIKDGDIGAFERFWLEGGTEEGDAKIFALRELIVLRYAHRQEKLKSVLLLSSTIKPI